MASNSRTSIRVKGTPEPINLDYARLPNLDGIAYKVDFTPASNGMAAVCILIQNDFVASFRGRIITDAAKN